jgi:hypothetical protein
MLEAFGAFVRLGVDHVHTKTSPNERFAEGLLFRR